MSLSLAEIEAYDDKRHVAEDIRDTKPRERQEAGCDNDYEGQH